MDLIAEAKEGEIWRKKFHFVKYDRKVINALNNDNNIITTDEDCSKLQFGEDNADLEITIFSNPYCSPCADLHKQLHSFPHNIIRIRYVMTYFSDSQSIINKNFIAAYLQLGKDRTWDLLCKWYDGGKQLGESFFDGLGLNTESPEVLSEFHKHKNWREQYSFKGTPTIIFQGNEIKWPYDINDIIMMK